MTSCRIRDESVATLSMMADRRLGLWPSRQNPEMLRQMSEGTFRFLNLSKSLVADGKGDQPRIDWHPDAPRLWRFHLHYHESLLELASLVGPESAWAIVRSWLDDPANQTPTVDPDAWHPFCISQRLPVWLMLASRYDVPMDVASGFWQSVGEQVDWLWNHLEWDLGGNHLLENLRALAIAHMALESESAIRSNKLYKWIDRELSNQILSSGEHFERTPTYHAIMTLAVQEIADSLQQLAVGDLAESSQSTAKQMAEFLQAILHPDGQIPLLGDSVFEETPNPRILCSDIFHSVGEVAETSQYAASELSASPATNDDYWVWRSSDQQDFLLFDVGAVACDHLPAHGHADLLGIEASVAGHRFLVDTGTYDYEDTPLRQASRSTLSHNTVTIDGEDQCDVWSRFRMGRRGHVRWKKTGRVELAEGHQAKWCMAAHDAYKFLGITETVRAVIAIENHDRGTNWLIADWFIGRGIHDLVSTLQIEPDWKATIQISGDVICEHPGLDFKPQIRMLTAGELTIEPGVYCPDFGVALPNESIVAETNCVEREPIGWLISPDGSNPGLEISLADDHLVVTHANDSHEILRISIS
ncbi:heparinase II/III family protein [Novipirellula aureliae]|uniref:heparinase II/III family protein n=1 Tax=Novipirellula aureliae TaxID=2527966 RepID=UPI0018CF70A5|nr:heparinase II/III family protein [Novipirellula aureliae]